MEPTEDHTAQTILVLDRLQVLRREKFRLLDQGGQAKRIWAIDDESNELRKKIM